MKQLESFLAKDKKTDKASVESKEVSLEEDEDEKTDESEEGFDSTLNLNMIDLMHLGDQAVELTEEAGISGELVIPSEEAIGLEEQYLAENTADNKLEFGEEILSNLDSQLIEELESMKNSQIEKPFDTISSEEIEEFISKFDGQLSEEAHSTFHRVIENMDLLDEKELENIFNRVNMEEFENFSLKEKESYLINQLSTIEETIESSLDVKDAGKTVIPSEGDHSILKNSHFNRKIEGSIDQEAGIDTNTSIEETEAIVEQEIVEVNDPTEIGIEEESMDELSNNQKVFEPVNRMPVVKETKVSIQKVAQEEFVSTIETLIIEETESTSASEKVTTARIQLTPDHLGKVDLQIEIKGKELTVKLMVEQQETKEWMERQLTQLKEKLQIQELTVKDFQVVVDEDSLNNQFMSNEENPFFKQKEKESQERKKQGITKNKEVDSPIQSEARNYSDGNGISILV